MNLITSADLQSIDQYELQREAHRRTIIDLKRRRRILLGDKVTLLFENRTTLHYQIQEMIRVERILDPDKIQDELDVYNALLPHQGELSASLMIELTDADTMKHWLDLFKGLDHGETVSIRVGGDLVYGEFEGGHSHETKISAVHFVRFHPSPAMIQGLGDPALRVTMMVNHPGYVVETEVPWTMREEWRNDLNC